MNENNENVIRGENVVIGEYCVLACPKEKTINLHGPNKEAISRAVAPIILGDRCILNDHVSIYEGTVIGPGCVIEDRTRIGYDCKIGSEVRIMYGSHICDRAKIGDYCRIGGFICDGAEIGEKSTIMGSLIHEYSQPHMDWWETEEPSPIIMPNSVVGYGAIVIGGVRIGPFSYIAAGAIVTKSVPPKFIVTDRNKLTPINEWKGQRLGNLFHFWEGL